MVTPASDPHRGTPSFRALFRGAWLAVATVKLRFFLFVFLFIFAYTIDLLAPWAIGYTLGIIVKDGFGPEALVQATYGILAYVGFKLTYTVCHHLGRYFQITTAFEARRSELERVFGELLLFPLSWHVDHHSGESLSRLHRSAGAVDAVIGNYVWQLIEGIVKVVFASIAIVTLDFWVALNVSFMGAVTILMMVLFNKRLTSYIRRVNAFYDRLNRVCVDYLFNVVTVKSLSLERSASQYLKDVYPSGRELSRRIAAFGELKWGAVGIGYTLVMGTSLGIFFYRHQGIDQPFEVAEVYVLLNYLDRIFQAIGSFTGYYSGLIESATAYEDATKIDEEAKQVRAVAKERRLPAWNALTFERLEYRYIKGEYQGIHIRDLEIKRGEKIALVGPSGSGKSTLLKVLGGMLLPQEFEIKTDRGDKLSLDDMAGSSLLLPQEPEIFTETVRYNLTMGEKFRPEELSFFSSLCRLEDVIEKIQGGWEANLAEKGLNLSGGERQRFALARGLLRASRREFLLLDEPTSSLDPTTEKQIFFSLIHHFSDRTILTACHRLALVPLFDRILFVRRGIVEENGSFQELLAKKGAFASAWEDFERKVVANPGASSSGAPTTSNSI
jgi:ATP-binding cassette subfamily B protein